MIQLLYFIPHIIDTIAASMSHQPAIEGDPASGLLKKLSECAELPSSQRLVLFRPTYPHPRVNVTEMRSTVLDPSESISCCV